MLLKEKAMSKDMLGSAVRAAVGVPQEFLELHAKLASKLSEKQPISRPEGEVWHAYLKKIHTDGLPAWAYLLGVTVNEVPLGEFTVDYDNTVESKLESEAGRALILTGDTFKLKSQLSRGMFSPASREGKVRYKASAASFSVSLTDLVIMEWARQKKRIMAGSQEGVDLVLSTPVLKFARVLPLGMFGECLYDDFEYSHSPSFGEVDGRLRLDLERFEGGRTPSLWAKGWHYLTLEGIPLEA
jgi:hypothetical protein